MKVGDRAPINLFVWFQGTQWKEDMSEVDIGRFGRGHAEMMESIRDGNKRDSMMWHKKQVKLYCLEE